MDVKNELSIIHEMCTTLNLSRYDQLSEQTKSFIVKIVTGKGVKYKSLSRLLYNYFRLGKEPLYSSFYTKDGIVVGPGFLRRLKSKHFDKVIYLFGEYHLPYNAGEHMRVTTFLTKLFDETPVPIDFYIENYKASYERYSVTMERDMKYLIAESPHHKCVRVHSIDMRDHEHFPIYVGIVDIYDDVIDTLRTKKDFKEARKLLKTTAPIKKDYKTSLEAFKQHFFDNIDNLPPCLHDVVKYGIDIVTHFDTPSYVHIFHEKPLFFSPYEKKSIREQLTISHNLLIEHLKGDYNKTTADIMIPYITQIKDSIFNLVSIYIDAYTLSQMFLPQTNMPYQNNITPRNIICYTGARHTRDMSELLQLCGFKEEIFDDPRIAKGINVYPYKLDLRKLGQFFPL